MRKTKIICTLGPSTDDKAVLEQLMISGMDVARINMSHQDHETHKKRIAIFKEIRNRLGLPTALLLDTKGPEIRTGKFREATATIVKGQPFTLTARELLGDESIVSISYKNLPKDVSAGSSILIDDGLIELIVDDCTDSDIHCTVVNGGSLSSNKGINVPGVRLTMPFISDVDKSDLKFAVDEDFDFVASSFTRSRHDVLSVRNELKKHGGSHIRLIAKIENIDGVNNIDDIIKLADGIMIARGDLGVEIPLEDIPVIQKQLIRKAYEAGKDVITATQMLESMIKNPRPTRAESTDVANAIYDGTSAIMLSGETAAGKYPLEALRTMSVIAQRTEGDIDYQKRLAKRDSIEKSNITSAISHATCTTVHDLGAVAIITVSKSGRTARMVAKYRPNCPIIAGTTNARVLRQMNLSWGVIPVIVDEKTNTDELFHHVVSVACSRGFVQNGDLVVITAGVPLGISGTTNLIKAHIVGNVLISGVGLTIQRVKQPLCVCSDENEARSSLKPGDILVVPYTCPSMLDLINMASAVVTEEDVNTSYVASVACILAKPVIVGARKATKILKSGEIVSVDANKGVVFSDLW